jgi:hypothetical protein
MVFVIVAFVVVAAAVMCFTMGPCDIATEEHSIDTQGSTSTGGETDWTPAELATAAEDVPNRASVSVDCPEQEDETSAGGGTVHPSLYATGNKEHPTVRPKDLGATDSSDDICVGKDSEGRWWGASTFALPQDLVTRGWVWHVLAGTPLPPDLRIEPDGANYGGRAPTSHHTIRATREMSFTEFEVHYYSLLWQRTGERIR